MMKVMQVAVVSMMMSLVWVSTGTQAFAQASLFFTPEEIQKLEVAHARAMRGENMEGLSEELEGPYGPDFMAVRDVKLGGIIYEGPKKWSIWLNGEKISYGDEDYPVQLLNVSVRRDQVKIIWYDPILDREFPIQLRPHQSFNLDTQIFLPG